MYGLDPGIALGSTRVYRSLWCDPRISKLYFLGGCYFPLCVPTSRNAHVCGNKVGSIMCSHIDYSLSFIFGFLKTKYSNILS